MEEYRNYDSFSGTSMTVRCYESHPVLKVGKGRLYGGCASSPKVKDADVYVSLQSGSVSGYASDPWDTQGVVEVFYPVPDMQAPANLPRFKKLVTWVGNQLQKGKTVHVGCIGGHGRTGTLLAAIVAEVLKEKDAIAYVRKHYCKKAVESKAQVQFLVKHYGVATAEPTKGETKPWTNQSEGWFSGAKHISGTKDTYVDVRPKSRKILPEGVTMATKCYVSMDSSRSLWSKPRKK